MGPHAIALAADVEHRGVMQQTVDDGTRASSARGRFPLGPVHACFECFGPLDPVYDWDRLRATVTRERLASGPLSLWRYADLLPVEAPGEPRLAP